MCTIPIQTCTLPNGRKGYKYGNSGKCYKDGRDAAKQGIAIEGSVEKFKKVMKSEGSKEDWVFVKAAIEEYEKENKLAQSSAFKSIASYLSKADPGQNDSDRDLSGMLDNKGDISATAKKVVETDDAGPNADSDGKDDTGDLEFSGTTKKSKADPQDGDDADPERDIAALDSPTDKKAGNIVNPPYNKEASPETDPKDGKPTDNYPVYTKNDTAPSGSDNRQTLDPKVQYKVKSATDPETTMDDEGDCKGNVYSTDTEEATEATWKSIAYIPQAERDKIDESDFAGPHRSFPCSTPEQVKNAAHLVGHSANPTAVKRKIIEIARRKGFTHALPDSWKAADEQSHASVYAQALALFGKLSANEKKTLADKLEWQEMGVNGPQENAD